MHGRNPFDMHQLRTWLDDLMAYLDAAHRGRDDLDAVRDALGCEIVPAQPPVEAAGLPSADAWLAEAVARATSADARLAAIAQGIARLAPSLRWYRRPTEAPDAAFEHGHANAIVIGGAGLATLGGLIVGISLLAPGVAYPVHRHPPDEVYVVLSDGQWWRDGTGWWTPGAGQLVLNDGGVLHSMRAGDVPLLAVWFLSGATAGGVPGPLDEA